MHMTKRNHPHFPPVVMILVIGTTAAVFQTNAAAQTKAAATAVDSPTLVAEKQERKGDWIRVEVSVSSKADCKITFTPGDVVLHLTDGSTSRHWRWLTFFPKASADLKKDGMIGQVGTDIGCYAAN